MIISSVNVNQKNCSMDDQSFIAECGLVKNALNIFIVEENDDKNSKNEKGHVFIAGVH